MRGWIDGLPLHIAKPHGEEGYFRSAKAVLRKLHRAGICHNDLAKEQNWLRGTDGRAYLTDFQLAALFPRRTWLFRIAAYEDLRHLLKHKRRYAPDALTPAERRVLAKKSLPTRIWMATGKKVYYWITRDVLRFTDREGGGPRLVYDAPRITARLKAHPQVRESVVVAFPDRRAGTGLYAFVEGAPGLTEHSLREFMAAEAASKQAPKPPEHLQVIDELPRNASGEVRNEILQLVAMNQVDLIDGADRRASRSAAWSPASSPTAATCATASRSRHGGDRAPVRTEAGHFSGQRSSEYSRRPPGRAPDQPLPPPLRDLDRDERIVVAPLHAREHRPRKRNRQQRGQDRRRCRCDHASRRAKMAAGMETQFGQGRAQLR